MAEDRLADQRLALKRIHHRGVGAEIAAPAHAHGRKDGNIIWQQQSLLHKACGQRKRSSRRTKGGDGNTDGLMRGKTEQWFENEVDL